MANDENKAELNNWLSLTQYDAAQKVSAVTAIYNAVNVRQHAENEMHNYADNAFKALDELALPAEKKEYLKNFADSLMVREY